MKAYSSLVLALLLTFSTVFTVSANPLEAETIGNVSIRSTYPYAGTVVTTLGQDTLQYQFVEGRLKGAAGKDLKFSSKRIGDGIFLVSWHDTVNGNYVSLIFDLRNKVEHITALMGYPLDNPGISFQTGTIDEVTWTD